MTWVTSSISLWKPLTWIEHSLLSLLSFVKKMSPIWDSSSPSFYALLTWDLGELVTQKFGQILGKTILITCPWCPMGNGKVNVNFSWLDSLHKRQIVPWIPSPAMRHQLGRDSDLYIMAEEWLFMSLPIKMSVGCRIRKLGHVQPNNHDLLGAASELPAERLLFLPLPV